MRQCPGCSGLIPEASSGCPNCAVTPGRSVGHTLLAAVGVATLVGACVLPQPAYGISCTQPQVDGGMNGCYGACDTLLEDGGDPTKDPDNFCFVDAGSP